MKRTGGLYKLGSRRLRKALYFPALTGKVHNRVLKAMAQRLEERGVTGMSQVAALMRKMLVLVFGVLKTKQPFDPDYVVNVQLVT
jgi:transposase